MIIKSQENPILKVTSDTNGQILYFFGSRHTNDPHDPQFDALKSLWKEFREKAGEGKVAFVEARTGEVSETYEEAIRAYAETGALKWLAREAGVEVMRPEPKEEEERKLLCDSFPPEVVAYALVVQNLAGWFRQTTSTTFEEALKRSLNREEKFSQTYGFVSEKSWFEDKHKELFGEQKLEDKDFFNSITDPRTSDTVINTVIALRSKLRNEHILSVITEAWKARKSIFIAYGRGHLIALEPYLKAF